MFKQSKFMVYVLYLVSIIAFWQDSQADVVLDGSFGHTDILSGQNIVIDAALGQQVGNNLFHSFKTFNLQAAQTANFTGNADIKNIISRVTGGEMSMIDGTLRSIMPADLYFINPAGILFGENAKLDLAGSAHFSTANVIKLGETGQFSATAPQNSLLTVAPPSAFGFLDSPAALTIQNSKLQLSHGQTLSLLAGQLALNGSQITIPKGKIQLVSVATPSELSLKNDQLAEIDSSSLGDLQLTDTNLEVNDGGALVLRGKQIDLHNSQLLARTMNNDSQEIDIQAENLNMVDGRSLLSASTDGRGIGGTISIQLTGNLRLAHDSQIASNSRNESDKINGNAGTIHITANTIEFSEGAGIQSSSLGTGNGGQVLVDAQAIHLNNGIILAASGSNLPNGGHAGNITLNTTHLVMQQGTRLISSTLSGGNAGTIHITADTMELSDESQIWTTTLGTGTGGDIKIAAKEIYLNNSHLFATSESEQPNAGDAGNISLITNKLAMTQTAKLDSTTTNNGKAGAIQIVADTVQLSDDAVIQSATLGNGSGGQINLEVKQDINLHNAKILATSESEQSNAGKAGDMFITAGSLTMTQQAQLSSSAQIGNSGTIQVATDNLDLSEKSYIESSVFGSGDGGKVIIQAKQRVNLDEATIFANSESEQPNAGDAGSIILTTDQLSLRGAQLSSETFGDGRGGTIVVHANHVILDGYAHDPENIEQVYAAGFDTSTEGTGEAGQIQLVANTLEIKGGAAINSSTKNHGAQAGQVNLDVAKSIDISGAVAGVLTPQQYEDLGRGIVSQSVGLNASNAGNLWIRTPMLNLTHQGRISTSAQQAQAGKITLAVSQLNLRDAAITSEGNGDGDAGNIMISATEKINLAQSKISTQAQQAGGGNISLLVNGQWLALLQSDITTSVKGGFGGGGNIDVMQPKFTVLNESQIIAQADGGNGGNIHLSPQHFIASPLSLVSASSKKGIDGEVIINAPESDVSCGLISLPNTFLTADNLLRKPCHLRTENSSFIVQPREGIPNVPDDLQSSYDMITY
jgi:filamentous hemagglutinin family protein